MVAARQTLTGEIFDRAVAAVEPVVYLCFITVATGDQQVLQVPEQPLGAVCRRGTQIQCNNLFTGLRWLSPYSSNH